MNNNLPKGCKVVVIGGGVVGTSCLYHLAKFGWKDVILLERDQLTSGTTWHAAGLVSQLGPSAAITKIRKYTLDLYKDLEKKVDHSPGLRLNGALSIAENKGRWQELQRQATTAQLYDVDVRILNKDQIKKDYPIINTDPNGQIWIRWNKQFDQVSASNPADFYKLSGKVVILGVTAEGIGSIIASPKGPQYSYLPAATTLQNLLDGDSIQRPFWAYLAELTATAVVGIIIVALAYMAPYWIIGLSILAIGGGLSYGALYAWQHYLYLLDVSIPILALLIVGLHAIFNRFITEYLQKMEIKKQFAGYASPTVVRMLQENPALIKEGMKREVSICFSDLRGFTPLGESFGDDVKGLTKIMNGYMDAITQPVLDMDGMIIKYIGDASMHVHNAPIDDPHHPRTAVQCGLDMLKAVEKFNVRLKEEGRPPVGMGAGINTGLGYLGEMGSTQRHSYDVLGDSVSTAARIESKCKEYGCVLLIGENTYERTKDDFFYLKIDDLAVKGKTVGIGIWTVLDDVKPAWRTAKRKHEEMHELYRSQKFDDAIASCNLLHNHFDGKMSGYYDMWIERCEYMKTQDLPDDWNGVFIATTK